MKIPRSIVTSWDCTCGWHYSVTTNLKTQTEQSSHSGPEPSVVVVAVKDTPTFVNAESEVVWMSEKEK